MLVGIHGDTLVNRIKGGRLPLMSLNERILSVLGCRYVDNVLIDAPYEITTGMISTLDISEVVSGESQEEVVDPVEVGRAEELDRFRFVKAAGIFASIKSPSTPFRIEQVYCRIREQQETFLTKFHTKIEKEREFYVHKHSCNVK